MTRAIWTDIIALMQVQPRPFQGRTLLLMQTLDIPLAIERENLGST